MIEQLTNEAAPKTGMHMRGINKPKYTMKNNGTLGVRVGR